MVTAECDSGLLVVKHQRNSGPIIDILCDDGQDDDGDFGEAGQQPPRVDGDLLALFAAPLSAQHFLQEYNGKRCLAVLGDGEQRLSPDVIRQFLCNLDVERLLEATPSPTIQVTMPQIRAAQQSEPPRVFDVDSVAAALSCYSGGASLYFRAPQEFTDSMVSAMLLGINNFAGFVHGELRGEVETFVTSKGHVTEMHSDFQHNFTFQLKGSKKWTLAKGLQAPLRGYTPHYGENESAQLREHQVMAARIDANSSQWTYETPESSGMAEVVLQPGDVLYHPAGVMHQVECLEDSISINLSLFPASYADFLGDAVKHLLNASLDCRGQMAFQSFPEARLKLQERLTALKKTVASLTVDELLPPSMIYQQPCPCTEVSLRPGSLSGIETPTEAPTFSIGDTAALKKNRLAIISKGANETYSLYFLVSGEELVPWQRTVIKVPRRLISYCDSVIEKAESQVPFELKFLESQSEERMLVYELLKRGYLVVSGSSEGNM